MMKKDKIYNVAVLGANGGIGKHAVVAALNAGYHVTAILRTPNKLEMTHPNLEVAQGDLMNPSTFEKYLVNTDVVISAIGRNSLKKTTLYSQGNRNLIDVLKRVGTTRAFFISASGLEINPTHSLIVKLATRFILQPLLHNMYADLRRMENIIKESNLGWTIMRPPKLLDAPETGKYRIAIDGFLSRGLKISRADVAHFMIHNLDNKAFIKRTVEVAY